MLPRTPAPRWFAWLDARRNWLAAAGASVPTIVYSVDRYRHGVIATFSTAAVFLIAWALFAVVLAVACAMWEENRGP